MAIEQINAGSAPIVWSTIDQAFKVINDNFIELALSVGGGGVVDLTALASTVAPVTDETYDLGLPNNRWRDLYLDQFVYLGSAVIKSSGTVVNLPAGSTIGNSGQLLDENYFKTIKVTGQNDIVADQGTDNLNINFGNGLNITTNSSTDTITFNNTGVLDLSAGSGINVTNSTGSITVANTGVLSLSGTTGQIGVSGSTGSITLTNLGVIELRTDPGSGIGLSAGKGIINITNLAPNIAQQVFRFISVPGQGSIEADNAADTLTISSGYGINITTTPLTDTINVALNQEIDIIGSVFSDSSSLMVDAVDEKIYAAGGFIGNLTGDVTGNTNGTHTGNVIGDVTGNTTGYHTGDVTGSVFADNSTMLIDGTNGQIVGPINSFDSGNSIAMNPTFGVIIGGTGGAQIIGAAGAPVYIGGGSSGSTSGNIYLGNGTNQILLVSNTIDTDDSTAINFTPAVFFNSDVTIENELIVGNIPGYVKLDTLKSVVAASTSFNDFQARIAAL